MKEIPFFALPQDIAAFTGYRQQRKQIQYLTEKGMGFHINSAGELHVPRVELERALAIQSRPAPKVAVDWIESDAPKISRNTG